MRAGCFAETRVIRLLNRRFVSFYYNTGGPGLGKDPAAAAFTKGKTQNTFAFYAAFAADGEPLGVTDVYADKDGTFDFTPDKAGTIKYECTIHPGMTATITVQ